MEEYYSSSEPRPSLAVAVLVQGVGDNVPFTTLPRVHFRFGSRDEDDDAVKAPPQELGDLGEESEMLSPARDLSMANMSVTALDGSNIAPGEVNVPGAGER